jgi:NADH-quinone oxidoreductase subunit G
MKSRGNHSYIDTFDGRPFDNPWSACAADVCPVGALTVREFRFRARVWHLEETKTLCPGCSIGCNVLLGHLNGVVHRFVPRENAEVNGWWMCDYGRLLAEGLDDRTIDVPLERFGEGERRISWDAALAEVARWLREARQALVIASANLSNEALFAVRRNLLEGARMDVIVPISRGETRRIKNGRGAWSTSVDAHPNSAGARHLGLATADAANIESYLRDGTGPVLVLDAHAHPWLASEGAATVTADRQVAVLARYRTPLVDAASIVMPLASWAETDGTFTSSTGRVQLAHNALPPRGEARRAWEVVYRLALELGLEQERALTTRMLFAEMAAETAAFSGMTWGRLMAEPGMPVHEEVLGVG